MRPELRPHDHSKQAESTLPIGFNLNRKLLICMHSEARICVRKLRIGQTGPTVMSMVDRVSVTCRSKIMRSVPQRGNKTTELRMVSIMKAAHINGWRRQSTLSGKPDFVFPKQRLAVFVDGCFWHGCPRCYAAPETNKPFWIGKVLRNKARDRAVRKILERKGWRVLRFWECRLKNPSLIERRLRAYLSGLSS